MTGLCWDCGGACLSFKGRGGNGGQRGHGWRCRACIDAYLDASARKYAELERYRRAQGHEHVAGTVLGKSERAGGQAGCRTLFIPNDRALVPVAANGASDRLAQLEGAGV